MFNPFATVSNQKTLEMAARESYNEGLNNNDLDIRSPAPKRSDRDINVQHAAPSTPLQVK